MMLQRSEDSLIGLCCDQEETWGVQMALAGEAIKGR
jgi:hypothetical protein